jgi:hypothetical protein
VKGNHEVFKGKKVRTVKSGNAKFQDFCMSVYFHIIYVGIGFLKFYTEIYF